MSADASRTNAGEITKLVGLIARDSERLLDLQEQLLRPLPVATPAKDSSMQVQKKSHEAGAPGDGRSQTPSSDHKTSTRKSSPTAKSAKPDSSKSGSTAKSAKPDSSKSGSASKVSAAKSARAKTSASSSSTSGS